MTRLFIHLSLSILILLGLTSCCKEESVSYCWVWSGQEYNWEEVDEMPVFINGGETGFNQLILTEISYPAEARENGIEGQVVLTFEITVLGTVENILITKDIGFGCGEEARTVLETITAGGSYEPARMNGIPVQVRKELAITFELQ